MKEELEKILVEKYPTIFKDYKGDPRKTCMAWGIACGDGWFNLVDELCSKLSKYPDVVAAQVKEKFGGLRFYIDGVSKEYSNEVYDLINEYEIKSLNTCDVCGKKGKRRSGGWVRTLCDKCHKEER